MKEKAGAPSDAESRRLLKAGEDAFPMLWLPSRALKMAVGVPDDRRVRAEGFHRA